MWGMWGRESHKKKSAIGGNKANLDIASRYPRELTGPPDKTITVATNTDVGLTLFKHYYANEKHNKMEIRFSKDIPELGNLISKDGWEPSWKSPFKSEGGYTKPFDMQRETTATYEARFLFDDICKRLASQQR